MTARDEILNRIRACGRAERAPVGRTYRHAGTVVSPATLLEDLAARLSEYGVEVHRCATAEIADQIGQILARRSAKRVACPGDLPTIWLERAAVDPCFDGGLTVEELNTCDATVTACSLAIADTGTIVLDGGDGQGRRLLSLIPDHLVIVVRAEQVVALVPDAIAALDARSPQTWISGPSATSDIELRRVEGVHGPRRVDVVLAGDSRPVVDMHAVDLDCEGRSE